MVIWSTTDALSVDELDTSLEVAQFPDLGSRQTAGPTPAAECTRRLSQGTVARERERQAWNSLSASRTALVLSTKAWELQILTSTLLRLEGNLDLDVAARRRGSHGGSDAVGMLPNTGPLGAARQNDNSDAPPSQVLLVADATVGREQEFETRFLCGVQERAVAERAPTLGLCGVDGVPGQRVGQPFGRAVVKEDEHRLEPAQCGGSAPRSRALP
jgi:hypothetical protein